MLHLLVSCYKYFKICHVCLLARSRISFSSSIIFRWDVSSLPINARYFSASCWPLTQRHLNRLRELTKMDGRVRERTPYGSRFSLTNRKFYWFSCLHCCLVHSLEPCIVNKSFLPNPASISSKAICGWKNYLISYNVEFQFQIQFVVVLCSLKELCSKW